MLCDYSHHFAVYLDDIAPYPSIPIMPFPLDGQGIHDFTDRKARQNRRRLAKDFWQDR